MFCSNCGTKLPDGGGFCANCGTRVEGQPLDESVEQLGQPESLSANASFIAPVPIAQSEPPASATAQPPMSPELTQTPMSPPATQPAIPCQPGPAMPDGQTAQDVMAPPEKAQKKSNKRIFIIIAIVIVLALIGVGVFAGINIYRDNNYKSGITQLNSGDYQGAYDTFDKLGDYKDAASLKDLAQQWIDYRAAQALLDAEDFEAAKKAFDALGSFEDSKQKSQFCQDNIDYLQAVAYYNAGKYEDALKAFELLAATDFKDSNDWIDKTNYALAEDLYDSGEYYEAWKAFKALGSYRDSADRMAQCTTATPGSGELYHNSDYSSTRSSIVVDAGAADYSGYYKIYSGSTLVAAFWASGGSSVEIELPEGDYSIKQAVGFNWFGEDIMFGDEGYYTVMTFDDGKDYFHLGDNIKATLTLAQSTEGNVGSKPTNRSDF